MEYIQSLQEKEKQIHLCRSMVFIKQNIYKNNNGHIF